MSIAEQVDTDALRKSRGAFFTPPEVADYVVRWAVRTATDRVLEPSCGEAAFLLAAHQRLATLPTEGGEGSLDGVELHDASARAARVVLHDAGADARIRVSDFFTVEPAPVYDAVIGNPPYVRYQDFAGADRAASRRAALHAGVALTGLASSWAAFTVHSALFLKPGGRLGLVLPAELLSVNYAAQVRGFLMRRFARVRLVLFTERIFPGVLEDVVLLLAEGTGGTDHCELLQVQDADALAALDPDTASLWTPATTSGKWTSALLPSASAAAYAAATAGEAFSTLHTWGETTLGMVTGANKFFTLSPGQAADLGLAADELLELSPPGSRHLRGLSFTAHMRSELGIQGSATLLFRPSGEPGTAARAYIHEGEKRGVDTAYKCRVRTPWWRVPLVAPADLLLTYMNADTPRLTTNTAGARHLNSVHGVYLTEENRVLGRELLPLASLNSVTLVGAEIVGRAYGGGMLKLEPREADDLPVPSPGCVERCADALRAIRPRVRDYLRAGRLLDAVRLVDRIVLHDGVALDSAGISELEQAYAMLAARRRARGASARDSVSPHAMVLAGRGKGGTT
ncbi:HsdM family class I SAM-dependent methyltransferase [Actinotalea subterranea]|uniref:HsdM family class I SAM-dependent methyltransferase n=1 Tax=Actinotalea subterranea TaxID=2607497 RepID=UPI0011EE3D37|nr:N-6 DNA methylase [Actinotalea subterranea]